MLSNPTRRALQHGQNGSRCARRLPDRGPEQYQRSWYPLRQSAALWHANLPKYLLIALPPPPQMAERDAACRSAQRPKESAGLSCYQATQDFVTGEFRQRQLAIASDIRRRMAGDLCMRPTIER